MTEFLVAEVIIIIIIIPVKIMECCAWFIGIFLHV